MAQKLDPAIELDGANLCSKCLRHFFDNAIMSELYFPPRWGKRILDPHKFTDILDEDFLKNYERKQKEWSLAPKLRVYCRNTDPTKRPQECGAFLGRRMEDQECKRCDQCMCYTCLRCKECFSSADSEVKEAVIEHDCDPNVEEKQREAAFAGLERGKHYQDCPNSKCRRRVELKEACNHIICLCGAEFCYLCGKFAEALSPHWISGSCPRYGLSELGLYDINRTSEDQSEVGDDPMLERQLQEIQELGLQLEASFLRRARAASPNVQRSRRFQEWPYRELHPMIAPPRNLRQGFHHSRNHHLGAQLRSQLLEGDSVWSQPRPQHYQNLFTFRHSTDENLQHLEMNPGDDIRVQPRQHHRVGRRHHSLGENEYNQTPRYVKSVSDVSLVLLNTDNIVTEPPCIPVPPSSLHSSNEVRLNLHRCIGTVFSTIFQNSMQ